MSNIDFIPQKTLRKVQALSGVTFGAFLSLHLVNAWTANGGHLLYDGTQKFFRLFYQNPFIEPIIIGSLVIHTIASGIRFLQRSIEESGVIHCKPNSEEDDTCKSDSPTIGKALQYHRYSGYFLATFVGGHFLATRGIDLIFNSKPDFSLISFSISKWGFLFYPYYFLLASCGLYHLSYGLIQSARTFQIKVPSFLSERSNLFWGLIGIGIAASFSSVLAFGGNYFSVPVERFAEHTEIYRKFVPHSFHHLMNL